MKAWFSGAFMMIALLLFGFVFGGLVATRIFTLTGMGFDQIADTLGGLMIGTIVAGLVGAVLLWTLSTVSRVGVGVAALVGTFASAAYLNATEPNVRVGEPVEFPPPPVESFSSTLQTNDPFEGPREDDASLPWSSLRMGSNLSFDYIALDNPGAMCMAPGTLNTPDGIARLQALREILVGLSANDVPCEELPCPTCTAVGFEWYLDQVRHTASFDAICWREEPVLQPLRAAVTSIVNDYANTVICEPQ